MASGNVFFFHQYISGFPKVLQGILDSRGSAKAKRVCTLQPGTCTCHVSPGEMQKRSRALKGLAVQNVFYFA